MKPHRLITTVAQGGLPHRIKRKILANLHMDIRNKTKARSDLEWINKKTKITIQYQQEAIETRIFPDYPNNQHYIELFVSIDLGNQVRFIDLTGNGYNTPYQARGYGKLIVNTCIQALHSYFGLPLNDIRAKKIFILAKISTSDDPTEEPGRSECGKRRNKFWSESGFTLTNKNSFNSSMRATLADLKIRKEGHLPDGTPCMVDLEDFWEKGRAPALLKYDIKELMAIDFNKYDIDKVPSQKQINEAYAAHMNVGGRITKYYWATLPPVSLSVLLTPFPLYTTLSFAGLMWISGFFLYPRFMGIIYPLTFSYRKYRSMLDQKEAATKIFEPYVYTLEKENNGLLWRIHQGMCRLGNKCNSDSLDNLVDSSKEQCAPLVSKKYRDYFLFMKCAKEIVKRKNLG